MVTRRLVAVAFASLWLAACGFSDRKFGDRSCNADPDCSRPDEACIQSLCSRRPCQTATECGPGQFACTNGGCVAQECTSTADCAAPNQCVNGFCAAPPFDVASATSANSHSIAVTFDAPPDPASATTLANYAVSGLDLSGAPSLSGSTVTIATSPQMATMYTVSVSNVTRALDAVPLTNATAEFMGRTPFDIASAISTGSVSIVVTFDAPPDPVRATTLANYSVPGLTLSGTPTLAGNAVTIATSPQAAISYTVTAAGVTRASDGEPLTMASAPFSGHTPFDVATAAAASSHSLTVTFDAPPNAAQATTLGNYTVAGLVLSGTPTLVGNTVTILTSTQAATIYTVSVANVTRASDGEPLSIASSNFVGRTPFDVVAAASATSGSITVTFDAPPDATTATTLANYSVAGLTLGGTPSLSGSTVTIQTSAQSAVTYTVNVANVLRASDTEPLTGASTTFVGRTPFDVVGAASVTSRSITVTFDAPPDPTQAMTLANYSIPGITLSGTPTLSGSTVTITTSPQSAITFTLTVSGITRASDAEPLTVKNASFTGRAPFDVASASSVNSHTITVTFDAPPDAASATTIGNYSVAGLVLSGAPSLSGNTVTLTTSPQSAVAYGVVVSNVTRASDGEPLAVASVGFTGRAPFDVASAASVSNTTITVTFDAPPNATQATTLGNYSISGLTLSGTATLAGNTVTITTSAQIVTSYTVVVSGVTRASDSEPLTTTSAAFTGKTGFNVVGASSVNRTTITVTFDAAPNVTQATTLTNYSVSPALALSGTPTLSGNTVTITTATQAAGTLYTVTVSGVTRASDAAPLSNSTATFTHTSFNVSSAASVTSHSITVTFDAPPNATQAVSLGNYSVSPGLGLTGTPTLSGNTVTIATNAQVATTYTVTVSGVTRASDAEPLTVATANFTGRTTFDVQSAASVSNGSMTVTFNAPPNAAQATTLLDYSVSPPLALSGTPVLSGNTVTISTAAQTGGQTYTVTVANVTRASDGEPLTSTMANFTGKSSGQPTVTNVQVLGTGGSCNVGTTPFNTGTVTVSVTGSGFTGATKVVLDDLDGIGNAVNTGAVGFTVNSDTSITAMFPAGIRTNGSFGWNVRVTNASGTNATSSVRFVPIAGLVITEVLQNSNFGSDEEFVEIFDATGCDLSLPNLGFHLHFRNSSGNDVDKPLTYSPNDTARSHRFFLFISQQSGMGDPWYSHRDAIYDAGANDLVASGSVYVSLSGTPNVKVLDKLGWGSQPAGGFEGTAVSELAQDASTQRKFTGTTGSKVATDSDDNASDFNAPSTTISPQGSSDPAP